MQGKYYREGNSKVKVPEVGVYLACSRKGKEGNTLVVHEVESSRK
jgi:hypothetical protein